MRHFPPQPTWNLTKMISIFKNISPLRMSMAPCYKQMMLVWRLYLRHEISAIFVDLDFCSLCLIFFDCISCLFYFISHTITKPPTQAVPNMIRIEHGVMSRPSKNVCFCAGTLKILTEFGHRIAVEKFMFLRGWTKDPHSILLYNHVWLCDHFVSIVI